MEQHSKNVAPEVLAQQKEYREAKERFRAAIKEAETEQKNNSCLMRERGGNPFSQASHATNRVFLRYLYIAYAVFRSTHGGYTKMPEKNLSIIEGELVYTGEGNLNLEYISKLIEKHGTKVVRFGA